MLWSEIKYQRIVLHTDNVADDSLFRCRRQSKIDKTMIAVPVDQRAANLKSILMKMEDAKKGSVDKSAFVKLAAEKHAEMKQYPHREEEDVVIDFAANASFYDELPSLIHVVAYYEDSQEWYLGKITKVNLVADCEACQQDHFNYVAEGFDFCFMIEFMIPGKQNGSDRSKVGWRWGPNVRPYHVPVQNIITCKPNLVPSKQIVIGRKRKQPGTLSFDVKNVDEIFKTMKENILYSFINDY